MNYEKTLIVRLTKKDHDKLLAKAEKKHISVSEYVRRMIKKL